MRRENEYYICYGSVWDHVNSFDITNINNDNYNIKWIYLHTMNFQVQNVPTAILIDTVWLVRVMPSLLKSFKLYWQAVQRDLPNVPVSLQCPFFLESKNCWLDIQKQTCKTSISIVRLQGCNWLLFLLAIPLTNTLFDPLPS